MKAVRTDRGARSARPSTPACGRRGVESADLPRRRHEAELAREVARRRTCCSCATRRSRPR